MKLKSSYEIFVYIYNIIKNELSNMIQYEDTKNIEEIELEYIVNIILNSINIDDKINFIKYSNEVGESTYKSYDEFIIHYIENTLLIYILQNNKSNIFKVILKNYFKDIIKSSDGLKSLDGLKNQNIFGNIKFYHNIYKTIEYSEDKIININFICNLSSYSFNILSIIYIFSINNLNNLNIYITHILEIENIIEIVKIINNINELFGITTYNNQIEIYTFLIDKYLEIIKKYENNHNSLIKTNYNKCKYELKKSFLNLNDTILRRINILSYLKVILSYFTKDEIIQFRSDYSDLKMIVSKYKDINIIFGYFDLIGYEKYEFNINNYEEKIYLLLFISFSIDYKDGIYIYEELSIKDKKKYLVSYLNNKGNEFICLCKRYKKIMYIECILDYLLKNDDKYINRILPFLLENKFENYIEYFDSIKKFIINPYIFNILDNNSHIKLLTICLSVYKDGKRKEENKQIINNYINNIVENEYKFSNIDINIDSKNNIINILYENDKSLLLYILKSYENINSKIIINLCNISINQNDMNFFNILFINFFDKLNIDIYNGIINHIKNNNFITYIQKSEYIKNIMINYVNYKKDYLININEKEKQLINFKCKCNICDSFYLNKISIYKNDENYNPIFYCCNKCNMNIHDNCLFEVIKNNRGKIKECVFCGSKNMFRIKLTTSEYKYILYNKLLNNFDFSINSLE